MFCSKCGKKIPDDSVFCQFCGHKLNNEFAVQEEQNQPIVQEEKNQEEQQKQINSDDEKCWYYVAGNEQMGPVTEEQMVSLIKNGYIRRDTMVWCERNSGGWIKAENSVFVHSFQGGYSSQGGSSSATNSLSDKWLWALATLPLLASIVLDSFIPSSSVLSWVIVVGLNCLFITLDEKELKENGFDAESWLWLGVVLVPLYLFYRAAKTNKNIIPGIVWCVLFVLDIFI